MRKSFLVSAPHLPRPRGCRAGPRVSAPRTCLSLDFIGVHCASPPTVSILQRIGSWLVEKEGLQASNKCYPWVGIDNVLLDDACVAERGLITFLDDNVTRGPEDDASPNFGPWRQDGRRAEHTWIHTLAIGGDDPCEESVKGWRNNGTVEPEVVPDHVSSILTS